MSSALGKHSFYHDRNDPAVRSGSGFKLELYFRLTFEPNIAQSWVRKDCNVKLKMLNTNERLKVLKSY